MRAERVVRFVSLVVACVVALFAGHSARVAFGAAAPSLTITVPANAVAGTAFSLTVASGGGYNGTVHFTSTCAGTLPANGTVSPGPAKTFNATLTTAGNCTITVADTSGTPTKTSSTIVVAPSSATHFSVGAPSTATAGVAFSVTVTALDAFNNTATGYTGTVHFTSSDGQAVLPANSTLTNGVGTFSSATLKTAGSQTITATDTVTSSITGSSAAIAVSPASATSFTVSAPSSATAGSAFSFTVTAHDSFGNTATGYGGTVHFTSTDALATLPANSTLVSGAGTFSATLDTAGTQTVTATDTSAVAAAITGTSNAITVSPAAASHFSVSAPASATAGSAFSFSVTALDPFNNRATGYAGSVHFTSTDGAGTLPANSSLTSGFGSFSATLNTAGTQTITATDTVTASITGTSNAITVGPAASTHFVVSAPASATAGNAFNYTVTASDAFGNTATNYTGTVHFTASDAQASLPSNTALTNGTGTFSATLRTAGTQTITATDVADNTVSGTSSSIAVSPSDAASFVVSAPSTATAGVAFNYTVVAHDAFGNTATGYVGTVHFTSSDGGATLPADATLAAGAGTFAATLTTAGTQSITATDTGSSLITGTSNAITVSAAAAARFVVVAPANATAGVAFTTSVTAFDAFGNVATGYTGTVHFTSTDGVATLPADSTLTGGTGSFSATLATAGTQTITATDSGNAAVTGTSGRIVVAPGPATHFTVSAPASTTAGASFSLTVTAVDQFDNVATTYTGVVHFTSTDGAATLPADSFLTNGTGAFAATLNTSGAQTITATDTINASVTGTSSPIDVGAAAPTHFVVSAPASATAGSAFNFTVTAQDQFGNTSTGYAGTVHFTSSDAAATLPADATLSSGAGTFSATLATAGNQTVTATDTATPSATGTSNVITVQPGAATHFTVTAPATATAGTSFSVTVTAFDAQNNVVVGYGGTVHFTSSDGLAVLPADATLTNGTGTFSATLQTGGTQSLTATDTASASITGTASITVAKAPTTTTVTLTPPTAVYRQPVTLTATVTPTPPATRTPTGTVRFFDNGTSLGSATLTGGVATLPATFTPGSHPITAVYQGDVTYASSTSAPANEAVAKADTTATLITNTDPSVHGLPVTFTAHVVAVAPGSGTPTGTVTFLDGATPIGTSTLDVSGQTTFTTTSLPSGSHTISARYEGDADFNSSTSPSLTQVVTASGVGVTLTSSLNPSPRGQSVTFTATVAAIGIPGTPGGSVAFTVDATTLGTSSLSGGVATISTSSLTGGTHVVTATYSGDGNFQGGATGSLLQSVTAAATSTSLVSSLNPSTVGDAVTFTATVSSSVGGTPSGRVVFLDGSSVLGLAAISGGSAAFTTSSLVAGTHPVTATYAGDSDFRASASAPLSQEVDDVATGQPDAGLDDGGVVNDDAGGGRDAGSSGDGGVGRDAGFPAFEAGLPNGTLPTDDSNCGCHVVGGDGVPGGTSGLLAAFGLAIAALGRRRSRKQNRATPSRGARRER